MPQCSAIIVSLGLGIAVSIVMGYLSLRKRALTLDGVAASFLVALAASLTGPQSLLYLIAFFVSSSAFTMLGYRVKELRGAAERKEGRNWRQVAGAGGVGGILFLASFLALCLGLCKFSKYLLLSALAVFSTSTADTWAAEIGALSKGRPRLITRPWVEVSPGTSGGVTILGELASASGAAFMGLVAALMARSGIDNHVLKAISPLISSGSAPGASYPWSLIAVEPWKVFFLVFVFGWLGEVVDSVVGATLQAKYFCPRCKVLTDKEVHTCGEKTRFNCGFKFVGNETTNIIATLVVAVLSLLTFLAFKV